MDYVAAKCTQCGANIQIEMERLKAEQMVKEENKIVSKNKRGLFKRLFGKK